MPEEREVKLSSFFIFFIFLFLNYLHFLKQKELGTYMGDLTKNVLV